MNLSFKESVVNIISKIPHGKVMSYGQVALKAGFPRSARQVGWILHGLENSLVDMKIEIPWWRVVNNSGRISIKGTMYQDALMQKALLEKEGLLINNNLTFNIERYRYNV